MAPLSKPLDDVQLSLAPLTGEAEHGLTHLQGAAQARARWVLAACLRGVWRGGARVDIADLTLSQFDACLAALYRGLYGDQLPSECTCQNCNEPFELRFELSAVQAGLDKATAKFKGNHAGEITAPSGRVFRLPRVADLGALQAGDQDAWLRNLLVSGDFDAAKLQKEIATAGPVLSQDIEAPCPDCAHVNQVRFDMADYLVRTLTGEAAFLWREVHLIARQYNWTLQDILSLTRDVRRQLTGLIVSEAQRTRIAS